MLSPRARLQHGFGVTKLPDVSTLNGNTLDAALQDNTQTPVPEQVAFRLDFPSWKKTRNDRDRTILDELMAGGRTLEVAGRHGLSAGRVSQLRREFRKDWERFCGGGHARFVVS